MNHKIDEKFTETQNELNNNFNQQMLELKNEMNKNQNIYEEKLKRFEISKVELIKNTSKKSMH